MAHLAQKTAIVTGSSRGIGKAIALRFAAEGAQVVLTGRDEIALASVAREITEMEGVAASIALDLRTPGSPERLAKFAIEKFGHIDIVVNNAGATKRGDFLDLTDADFDDGFALKYFGAVRLTRAAWPQLRERGGSVVFISGVGGRTPGAQFTIGGSVNAALLSFTKAIAELGVQDGVQVNAINPGTIRTGRMAARLKTPEDEQAFVRDAKVTRIGEPDDIAALTTFIVSPEGRFLHGSLIDADGGATKTI
jgi:NAD(P)-dependent dehydrogenase (short-subunit alcohol dehydrogenase family)